MEDAHLCGNQHHPVVSSVFIINSTPEHLFTLSRTALAFVSTVFTKFYSLGFFLCLLASFVHRITNWRIHSSYSNLQVTVISPQIWTLLAHPQIVNPGTPTAWGSPGFPSLHLQVHPCLPASHPSCLHWTSTSWFLTTSETQPGTGRIAPPHHLEQRKESLSSIGTRTAETTSSAFTPPHSLGKTRPRTRTRIPPVS